MARFVKGDLVVVPFPFADSAGSKLRPAIVLAGWRRRDAYDYLLCSVTATRPLEGNAIELGANDIVGGSLNQTIYVRPSYIWTGNESVLGRKIGTLSRVMHERVVNSIIEVLRPAS